MCEGFQNDGQHVAYFEVRMPQSGKDAMAKHREDFMRYMKAVGRRLTYEGQGYQDGSTTWCLGFVSYGYDAYRGWTSKEIQEIADIALDWWRDTLQYDNWLQVRTTKECDLEEEDDDF
jgi:hypothetical protein